jgi:hypothetical protein
VATRRARDLLAAKVYNKLHHIARHYMKNEPADNTLQAKALVNEVYLRLVDVHNVVGNTARNFLPSARR